MTSLSPWFGGEEDEYEAIQSLLLEDPTPISTIAVRRKAKNGAVVPASLDFSAIYAKDEIRERHRHRYEVNPAYVTQLESAGMCISGRSKDGALVESIEITEHPWFVACQFHP